LNPNSAAARRRRAAKSGADSPRAPNSGGAALPPVVSSTGEAVEFNSAFTEAFGVASNAPEVGNEDLVFSTKDNPFAGLKGTMQ
jgi:hypothetical protein